MPQILELDEKPRDAMKAPRGNRSPERPLTNDSVRNLVFIIAKQVEPVNPPLLLPVVVMFEQPSRYGTQAVVQSLAGKRGMPAEPAVTGMFWSGWYSCRKL